jgi:hypothetical protein
MTPTDTVFVDPLARRTAEVSAKLSRWLKDRKVPVDASPETHDALQQLRQFSPQLVPNVHQAVTAFDGESSSILALTDIDACVDAMHTLLSALPTDTRAFSVVDDLMSLRDDVEGRFPDARRKLTAISEDTDELAGTGAHRFGH